MRNFEERMAEIKRRSEKIVRERRANRKRLLLACIPLAVCIGLWSVLLLGQGGPAGDMMPLPENALQDDGNAMGTMTGTAGEIPYTELDVKGSGVFLDDTQRTVTDRAQVKSVYALFTEEYRFGMSSGSITENKDSSETATESADEAPKDNYAPVTAYTFTFRTPGGAEAVYTLQGDALTDQATGETRVLMQEQLSRLQDILEI